MLAHPHASISTGVRSQRCSPRSDKTPTIKEGPSGPWPTDTECTAESSVRLSSHPIQHPERRSSVDPGATPSRTSSPRCCNLNSTARPPPDHPTDPRPAHRRARHGRHQLLRSPPLHRQETLALNRTTATGQSHRKRNPSSQPDPLLMIPGNGQPWRWCLDVLVDSPRHVGRRGGRRG